MMRHSPPLLLSMICALGLMLDASSAEAQRRASKVRRGVKSSRQAKSKAKSSKARSGKATIKPALRLKATPRSKRAKITRQLSAARKAKRSRGRARFTSRAKIASLTGLSSAALAGPFRLDRNHLNVRGRGSMGFQGYATSFNGVDNIHFKGNDGGVILDIDTKPGKIYVIDCVVRPMHRSLVAMHISDVGAGGQGTLAGTQTKWIDQKKKGNIISAHVANTKGLYVVLQSGMDWEFHGCQITPQK